MPGIGLRAIMNQPATLERARSKVLLIACADSPKTMMIRWAWCGGYIAALAVEGLIDLETRWLLESEADQARDGWSKLDEADTQVR